MFRIEKYIKGKAKYLHNVECRWCGGIAFSIMYYNLGVFFFFLLGGWYQVSRDGFEISLYDTISMLEVIKMRITK